MQVQFSATNIEQVGVRYRYLQTFFVISFELRPSALFRNSECILCYSLHSAWQAMSFRTPVRNPVWMLRCAQHDKGENVIPNASEESSMDAPLRSAWQAMSFRASARNPLMDASLRSAWQAMSFRTPVRNPVWMLRCAQHDKRCHSERQQGIHSRMLRFTQHDKVRTMDASRRSAWPLWVTFSEKPQKNTEGTTALSLRFFAFL